MSTNNKKYEVANFIPNDGDSIYPVPIEELPGGQIYYSLDIIKEIINEELDKRFGPSQKKTY
jgi:hypothetical protein